jgi:hypothetical protein
MAKKKKGPPELSLEVITQQGVTMDSEDTSGWGEGAMKSTVEGQIMEITLLKDDKPFVGLRILEDGDLVLTSYGGPFQTMVEQNLRLENMQPWK